MFVINKCSLPSYPSGLGEGTELKTLKGKGSQTGIWRSGFALLKGKMGARFGIENIHGMPKIMVHWD